MVLALVVLKAEIEAQIGILFFAMGVGGVFGALLAPSISRSLGLGRTLIVGMGAAGVGLFLAMSTNYGPLAIALQAFWMIGISIINIPLATIRQHFAAESMLGRVITVSRVIGWATLPIGALVGGWLGGDSNSFQGWRVGSRSS